MILNTNSTSLDKMTTLSAQFYNFTTEIPEYNNSKLWANYFKPDFRTTTVIPTSLPELISTGEIVAFVVAAIAFFLLIIGAIALCWQCKKAIRAQQRADQAINDVEQANRAIVQVNLTIAQANQDIDQANQRANQANQRADQADQDVAEANQRADQANQRADQADQRSEQTRKNSEEMEVQYKHLLRLARRKGDFKEKEELDMNKVDGEQTAVSTSISETDNTPTTLVVHADVNVDKTNENSSKSSADEETKNAPGPSSSSSTNEALPTLPERVDEVDKGASPSKVTDASSYVKKVNPKPAGSDEINKIESLEIITLKKMGKNKTEPKTKPSFFKNLFKK